MGRKNLPRPVVGTTLDVYAQCRLCRFWIASEDRFCPDCGIRKPSVTQNKINNRIVLLSVAVAVTALYITKGIMGWFALPALFIAIAAGSIVALIVKGWYEETANSCLQASEALIGQRAAENEKREAQIVRIAEADHHTVKEVDRQPTRAAHQVTADVVFENVAEMLRNRRDRYQAKLMEIELVRWANALAPFKDRLNNLSTEDMARCLEALDQQRRTGDTLRLEWRKRLAGNAAQEAQTVVKRLAEMMTACEKLRETLLVRQAIDTVRAVSPLEDELHSAHAVPPEVELTLREPDVFSARVALEDFNISLAELEAEHKRLGHEEELAKHFRRVIERR